MNNIKSSRLYLSFSLLEKYDLIDKYESYLKSSSFSLSWKLNCVFSKISKHNFNTLLLKELLTQQKLFLNITNKNFKLDFIYTLSSLKNKQSFLCLEILLILLLLPIKKTIWTTPENLFCSIQLFSTMRNNMFFNHLNLLPKLLISSMDCRLSFVDKTNPTLLKNYLFLPIS